MIRTHRMVLPLALLSLGVSLPTLATAKGGEKVLRTRKAGKQNEHGRVDWNKGRIYATGLGAISNKETNDAKAYLRARSFARMDARRNLLAVIDSVHIDSQTVGKDYEAVSDVVREQISGLVKGSEIIAERTLRMGNAKMVEVTVSMPLYGEEGLSSVFIPEMVKRNAPAESEPEEDARPAEPRRDEGRADPDTDRSEPTEPDRDEGRQEPEPIPLPPTPKIREPRLEHRPTRVERAGAPITGLIIDARGLNIDRSMCPKIRRRDGSEVWGTLKVSPDFVIAQGIVCYAHSLGEAKRHERAGSNPLVVKAAGRSGQRFATDVVLSDADAERLLEADSRDGFLDKFQVIFIVDAGK